jgi:hypothetical protein
MRSTLTAALIALFLFPAATMAQTATQTAAVDNAARAPSAPAVGSSMNSPTSGITRDQFIQRAKDRAGQRAAARFDQMDANHDGVLARDEIHAWRSQHPRRTAAQPAQPTAQ